MSRNKTLELIQVEKPCAADWQKMPGDDRSRFCTHCQQHVHDLSAMSRVEAERLICESAGNQCVRFSRARNGTIITLDYQQRFPKIRRWRLWAAVGSFAGLALAFFGCEAHQAYTMGSPRCLPTTAPTTAPSALPAVNTTGSAQE